MAKIQKRIEIVVTGQTGLNLLGNNARTAIQHIVSQKYASVRITFVNNTHDLELLAARRPDLVFLGVKYIAGTDTYGGHPDEIWISQYLDERAIQYTGSSYAALERECHKQHAKQLVLDAGLKTARFCVIRGGQEPNLAAAGLTYPLFIKPTSMGGGKGVDSESLVRSPEQANAKIRALHENMGAPSLVEEYLPGREFSVAVLRRSVFGKYLAMPVELIAPLGTSGERILSQAVKSADTETCTAVADQVLKNSLSELALQVFTALGARDYGRIDIRLDAQGQPHFLEANLVPSLFDNYGNFPKACKLNLNLAYESVILHIVELAIARSDYQDRTPMELTIPGVIYGLTAANRQLGVGFAA